MPLQIFFNDLSSSDAVAGHPAAVARLKGLVQALRGAKQEFRQVVFNAEDRLDDMNLGGEVYLAALRNEPECHEEALFLRTVTDRSPLGRSIAELEGVIEGDFEYRLEAVAPILASQPAIALGLSHRYSGLSMSLDTHALWRQDRVALDRAWLDPAGDLQTEKVDALNAYSREQVAAHAPALKASLTPTVENGEELWARREELFPYLLFIPRTRQQLEDLLFGDPVLASVVEVLTGLDEAIGHWASAGTAYPVYPFFVRPESRSRKGLTEFLDQNNVSRKFSDHCDFGPIEGRIHFILMSEPTRHGLVGHVGRKLGIG